LEFNECGEIAAGRSAHHDGRLVTRPAAACAGP
jgi:hypothetical protein